MEKSGTKNQSIAEPFREKTERKIMGRAKIIYTVDPDHFKADTMEQFILGGMDIARCVCMQKEKEEQSCFVKQVGDFFKKRKKPVEIMLDLSDRTEADWEDTSESFFEIAQSVKVILMPFFEKPERRKEIRDLLKKQGGQQILLITKVEKRSDETISGRGIAGDGWDHGREGSGAVFWQTDDAKSLGREKNSGDGNTNVKFS